MFSAYNVSTQYALIASDNCRILSVRLAGNPLETKWRRIQFTATQQWDELLIVAGDWARIDNHGGDEPEDSDEEEVHL